MASDTDTKPPPKSPGPTMVSPTLSGEAKAHKYESLESLQSQLGSLNDRLTNLLGIAGRLNSNSKRDEMKMVTDAIKDSIETSKTLDEMLINDASFIRSELEELMLKEDETDSSIRLKRQLRASGSGEDVEGLRSQIEEVSSRLIEVQSQKLILETRISEKDRCIKRLEDNLSNTLADMKHIRIEAQKSFAKHDKRTKEAESRVKSMASELKRANEMATRYKSQFEEERRRRSGNVSTPLAATRHKFTYDSRPLSPDEVDGPQRDRSNTIHSQGGTKDSKDHKVKTEDVSFDKNTSGVSEKNVQRTKMKRAKSASYRGESPAAAQFDIADLSSKTCLNVEDLVRKNHLFLEEAEDKDNEVKLWRSLFLEMTDKLNAYCGEMMRCQGETATLYEERMELKSRLEKEQKQNAIMKKELDKRAYLFVEHKQLQLQLAEEIKWAKLTPLAPTKIYNKARPKSVNKARPIPVQSWSG